MTTTPAPSATSGIALHNLTVAYRGHPAVHHLSGVFAPGSLTAVVGPNGAGKTSLFAAITGGLRPTEGEVRIAPALRGRIAWLPQQAAIDRSFPMKVFDLVALGHWARVGSFKALLGPQREQVHAALQAVGLGGFERRSIGELSAGQFQRVLFARVLLQDAPVILLDEPFNAIDARTTADLLAVVARWHAEARTVIAVLHDLDQVREHFSRTLLLARRCVAWGPTAEVLRAENLFRARQMAERWDDDAPVCQEAA
jgi:zinc/manganese transport system ATP-binding protein